ncbi:MAG: sigma-70 family RNA polymerase sigma factor [Pirellulales bacterium]
MALSEIDRNLLSRCLDNKPGAWEDFVDRFMGLVVHVVNHSAQARSIRLEPADRDDLCADVFLAILKDDFAVLRHFRAQSSLATYLAVIARRVVVRQLLKRKSTTSLSDIPAGQHASDEDGLERRISDHDEVERLIARLDAKEAQVVRLYHLEGRSYQEISSAVGMPENSVGPLLSRAREKMREAGAEGAGSEPTNPYGVAAGCGGEDRLSNWSPRSPANKRA